MAAQVQLNVIVNEEAAKRSVSNIEAAIKRISEKPIELKVKTDGIDQVTKDLIKYVNAQARLEAANAKTATAQAKLAQANTKLHIEQQKTEQSANKVAIAQEKTAQTANRLAIEQTKASTIAEKLAIAQERTTQSTNRLASEQEKTVQSANRLATAEEKTTQEMLRTQRQEEQLEASTNNLSGTFRMLASVLVSELRQALSSALTEMKAVDTELITIQKVTNESAEGMKRYADDAYEVASKLGASAHEYLNAVAEFAKAGYGEQSKELGELAITAAKVGDTTQSMANQFLLSVDAAYKYEGSIEKLTAVLDGANEIGNKFPTSVEKIAQGLGKVSPIASQAHVGIDELTAAIGTITAVTQRSGTEAATALRALYLNIIGDTKTEIEDGAKWTAGEIEGLRDVLRKYAPEVVKAAEATGELINPMEAIAALAEAMDSGMLSEQKLMSMVSDIGGKLRTSQLLALIQNFDKYQQMLETYRDSAGSAAQEYAIYLDSWEAKTNQLKATWTDFVQRQLGTDKVKQFLDVLIDIVDNLDELLPLLTGIGIAIASLGLPKLITNIVTLSRNLATLLTTGLGPYAAILGVISITIGAIITKHRNFIDSLKKEAKATADKAEKTSEDAKNMEKLVAQYNAAIEGSSDFQKMSEKMRTALENEGIAVRNLASDYENLTLRKLRDAQSDASEALGKAENYLSEIGGEDLYFAYQSPTAYQSLVKSGAVAPIVGDEDLLRITDTSPSGILAYYKAVYEAREALRRQADDLRIQGKVDEANAVYQTRAYKELSEILTELQEPATGYETALEKYNAAIANVKGFEKYKELSNWINKDTIKNKEELAAFLDLVAQSIDLTEEQKNLLIDTAKHTFPEYVKALEDVAKGGTDAADGIDKASSALGRYKEAMEGADKDSQFKEYKDVYDAVMKAAKRGAYGSNAFQYGIQALVDPEKIKEFKGNWAGLVKYIQESQGALYKSSESMGKGLLDRIYEEGKKTGKGLREIYDDETKKLLASYNKNTGEWQISNDPEDIKKLAGKLGMSAESLVAAGIALGAMDPNADVEGLSKALETILGGGEEKLTAEEQAAQTQLDAATKNADSATTFSTAVASFAEIMAAEATAHDEAEKNRNAPKGNGPGVGGEKTSETVSGTGYSLSEDRIDGGGRKSSYSIVSGTGYSLSEDRIDGGGRKSSTHTYIADRIPALPMTAEDQKRVFDIMNGNVVVGMTAAAINEMYGRLTTGDPFGFLKVTGGDRSANRPKGTPNHHRVAPEETFSGTGQWVTFPIPEVTGAVAEGVEQGLIESSQDSSSPVFHGTGSWASPADIPEAVSEGVQQGLQESASFSGTGKFVSADQIPVVNQGKFVSGDQVPWANKENAASPSIAVDTSEATAAIEETQSALDEIDNTEAEATATLDPSGAEEGASAAKAAIESIPTEVASHVVINVDINTTRHGLGAGGNSGGDWVKETRPTGDKNFHGGEVLVNDEPGGWNPELIVADGRAFIANGGDPVVLNLPRGSVIYNADETRSIFNGGSDLLNIPSFADSEGSLAPKDYGMSSGRGSKPYTPKKKTTPSSGSGSDGSGSGGSKSMSDDDMLKQLNEYMEQILDAAHDALDDQLEAINAQIYALKYQTEAAEKASALEEARLQLLEAEKNLLDANTERTVRYYNAATGQWEWMADQRKVLQAQEELADSQKNLLEAEYDALTTAWKELKDEIEKALKDEGGPIDIDKVLAALGLSKASGSKPAVESLIADVFGYTDDPRAYANFDGGGIAHGLGWMPKGNAGAEAVLDSNITNAILNPVTNAAFQGFTDSLTNLFQLAGGNVGLPSSRFGGNISNLYGGNTYIEGVKIGSDMMNRPLSEVLSTLNLYKNA